MAGGRRGPAVEVIGHADCINGGCGEVRRHLRCLITIQEFPDAETFGSWLAENHASAPGLWLKLHKKGSGLGGLTYVLALDEALRFGWREAGLSWGGGCAERAWKKPVTSGCYGVLVQLQSQQPAAAHRPQVATTLFRRAFRARCTRTPA